MIVAKPGRAMKIPLSETEALVGLLALKPTASMPPAKGESNWEEEGTSEEDQVIGRRRLHQLSLAAWIAAASRS
jgi:hypothetical protein